MKKGYYEKEKNIQERNRPSADYIKTIFLHLFKKHPYKEEVPKAFICLKEGYEPSDELDREIENLCRKNLDRYSQPYSYEYIKELPHTLLGKVSHAELKKEEELNNNQGKVLKKIGGI